jgi:glycosyltransferase involved in cell wall biosynthesis
MPRIALYVVNSARFFLSHRVPVARGAERLGLEVHVAAPDDADAAEVRKAGFPFHPISMSRRGVAPWREVRTIGELARLYSTLSPALVHHVTLKSILHGSYAARIAKVPAVVNAVTGLGYLFGGGSLRARLLRSAFVALARPVLKATNSTTVFQNEDDLLTFEDLGLSASGRSVLIRGSGVDVTRFRPYPERHGIPLVVLPSRMLWDKGVGVFVEAAARLRERCVPVRLALVGEPDTGNPRSVSSEQLRAWGDAGTVEVWGHRSDMAQVFAECSIVALPSQYREGVPKALIEAAACGRPIVTTDMPGCRDIVRHQDNGLLVAPGDAIALANAIAQLAGDSEQRLRMGSRGRALVEREFAQDHVVARTMTVYEALLSQAFPADADGARGYSHG